MSKISAVVLSTGTRAFAHLRVLTSFSWIEWSGQCKNALINAWMTLTASPSIMGRVSLIFILTLVSSIVIQLRAAMVTEVGRATANIALRSMTTLTTTSTQRTTLIDFKNVPFCSSPSLSLSFYSISEHNDTMYLSNSKVLSCATFLGSNAPVSWTTLKSSPTNCGTTGSTSNACSWFQVSSSGISSTSWTSTRSAPVKWKNPKKPSVFWENFPQVKINARSENYQKSDEKWSRSESLYLGQFYKGIWYDTSKIVTTYILILKCKI